MQTDPLFVFRAACAMLVHMTRARSLRGTPGAQSGEYAYAYVGKNRPGAIAYCSRTREGAMGGAYGHVASTIATCGAIAKGASCADAKKNAKKAAVAKCKPCRYFDISYGPVGSEQWEVVEHTRKGTVSHGMFPKGKPTVDEINRLVRKHCPQGLKPTDEELGLRGARARSLRGLPRDEKITRAAVNSAKRLGRAAADELVRDETCSTVGLMGDYERRHFGLGDFEESFATRLSRTLERARLDHRTSAAVETSAWRAWVAARNARVLELCPRAREYGDD